MFKTHFKYTLFVGLGYTKDGSKLDARFVLDKQRFFSRRLIEVFGGFTEQYADGRWFNSITGEVAAEGSWIITIVSKDEIDIRIQELAKEIRDDLRQQSVLVTKEVIGAEFV